MANKNNKRVETELRQIRNLLFLSAVKTEASAYEANHATGIGLTDISASFLTERGKTTALENR